MTNYEICVRNELLELAQTPPKDAHIKLYLDRYFLKEKKSQDSSDPSKKEFLKRAIELKMAEGYSAEYQLHKERLHALPHTRVFRLETVGRTIVGLGADSPWENNIDLHHTWGVPYISGSALKGLCSAYAHRYLKDDAWKKKKDDGTCGESQALLFGTNEEQGAIIFHDAIWVYKENENPLKMDVITVHHPDYYQGKKDAPPADWDSPRPIPFLSFHGRLMTALSWCGPKLSQEMTEKWLDAAAEILKNALEKEGIGAKTSSGYGRMQLTRVMTEEEEKIKEENRKEENFQKKLENYEPPKDITRLADFNKTLQKLIQFKTPKENLLKMIDVIDKKIVDKDFKHKIAEYLSSWFEQKEKLELKTVIPTTWFKKQKDQAYYLKQKEDIEEKLKAIETKKPSKNKKDKKYKAWKKEKEKLEKEQERIDKKLESFKD